ncbi:hypothetical protein [Streptomyces fradiae]|uniref:hypothetical protein n=1 Tax=Streptomyces fradiae TaxID=1906 RepID=UPI0035162793
MLGEDGAFNPVWLRGKNIVPVPVGRQLDAALARRIVAGCRAVGAPHALWTDLSNGADGADSVVAALPLDSGRGQMRPPGLVYTPDLQGAVLLPEEGYALVGGTAHFMAAAVGEGIDEARTRFARYAHNLAHRHPDLTAVADAYPSAHRAWSRPTDVEPGSAAARQLTMLHEFIIGACSAQEFARGWWEARRESQAIGERIRGPLADLFNRVFMSLEDYAIEPDLREPGDLSDAELQAVVREIMKGD